MAYVRPDEALSGQAAIQALIRAGIRVQPAIVVADGVSEAMTLAGLNIDSTGDVARFHADMPRRFERTGAAIVMIDHVVKAGDQRGAYAIGSQHKRAGVNGASFKFEVQSPFGRGRSGQIKVTVTKDRPGFVRQISSGGEVVGTLHIDSDEEGNVVTALHPIGLSALVPSSSLL